jgi:XTP/dITP diphosphohydrolase
VPVISEITVASGNQGKIGEIREILGPLGYAVKSLKDIWDPVPAIEETGRTFEENARIKAQWVHSRTGGCVLADDSGLEVDALDKEPGIRSARYCGEGSTDESNNAKLLRMLDGVALPERTARFRCAVAFITAGGECIGAEGVCEGVIGFGPKGTNGFGYDPLFIPLGFDTTFAQLDSPVKHALSHRGKALAQLKKLLQERL